jgi:nitric-oxide synthase, bacterial
VFGCKLSIRKQYNPSKPIRKNIVKGYMKEKETLLSKASGFIQQLHQELELGNPDIRIKEIEREINLTGSYIHHPHELEHGARMAWRNSNRCIGRLYWKSLIVNDRRTSATTDEVFGALSDHLRAATNNGKIIPMITIFPPVSSDHSAPFRIWNKHLIRYADDPEQIMFRQICEGLGWKSNNVPFELLPIVIQEKGKPPILRTLHKADVLEVELEHPHHNWFKDLGLKWHALPMISDMTLEIGGIQYPAAPFNGWYMVTEIGSRNLGDERRYNLLPIISKNLGIHPKKNPFWKDHSLVILNEAVYHSFEKNGISIADHHSASEQFMKFMRNEKKESRPVKADWAWIVPPLSGSAMQVFHKEFDNKVLTPNFFYNTNAWETKSVKSKCPFHSDTLQ